MRTAMPPKIAERTRPIWWNVKLCHTGFSSTAIIVSIMARYNCIGSLRALFSNSAVTLQNVRFMSRRTLKVEK